MDGNIGEKEKQQQKELEKLDSRIYNVILKPINKRAYYKLNKILVKVNKFTKKDIILLFEKIKSIGIKNLKYFTLSQTENKYLFKLLMNNCFVKKLYKFSIYFDTTIKSNLSYQRQILNFLPKVTKTFYLENYTINKIQFRKILQVGRHLERIEFAFCHYTLSGLRLSTSLHYSIKYLSLSIKPPINLQSLSNLQSSVKSLLFAASLTNLQSTLKELDIFHPILKQSITKNALYLKFQNLLIKP
ncbi:unnamed protein product [Moneuplotes crassus]|uniref:Uncharacterized protein n=1 Tax=Euplotes crassus TaxID=5936 RepID=A0AAD1XVG3_EUPCR|nr:unnamed protein product [Moneuplotes crassus]